MNSAEIKEAARSLGADLVGIAPVERFEGMPEISDPRTFVPETRSVIAVGYRILRGSLRGVEEGTNFSSIYGFFGATYMEKMYMSRMVYDLCCMIENSGAVAAPVLSCRCADQSFVPDYKEYAHAAGLGSTGKGGFFLTPEYGHRQRLAFIFTSLELEGDEVIECDFCKDCDACIKACPLGAYKADNSLDLNLCRQCQNGAKVIPNEEVDRCASVCARACMVALEDKIGNRFHAKFRKRSVWQRGIHGESLTSGTPFIGGKCPDKIEGK
ncbi:MAG: hypothetical protein J6W81_08895 [Lentisphaeria bacterium]|nr:hypothetical protein [Lentisphaeria bacterium]